MCGQENKKMSVQDKVEILTQECLQLRRELDATRDSKEKEKLVLKHIKEWANAENCVNDFQKGLEWFNVSEELSITQHLTGKVVALDFFTYCCINCMHILPDLDALEKKFSVQDGLVVIGVHSAKFSNEKDSQNILSAVQRYNISHPVVNDAKLSMWRDIGISCWPSLVILGPKAQPLVVLVGEGHREELFLYTKVALSYFKSLDQISKHDLPLKPAQHLLPISRDVLLFPGKVTTFGESYGERIVVSDTGNNRILVMKYDGSVEDVIGGYSPGFKDGNYNEARFNAPQGVCVLEDSIYVADTENHAIRQINMKNKTVNTIAGNGKQGHDYVGGKVGKEQILSSPWDVAIYNHEQKGSTVPVLLIAIAGIHQIWALFLKDTIWWKNKEYKANTCAAIVGSGKEENRNNSYPHAAGLAQPSGLAVAQNHKAIFFADSESSSIRRVHLNDGKVSAVAGADKNPMNLHNFGDVDGIQFSAKLQHPLGVAWDDAENVLYVADTYNHKIKRLDPSGNCETLYGAGKPTKDHQFNEPSGLAVSQRQNVIIIADTNNHCIKVIKKSNHSITTIPVKLPKDIGRPAEKVLKFSTEISTQQSELTISFTPKFNADLKFTPEAPQKWSLDKLPMSWMAEAKSGSIETPIIIKLPQGTETTDKISAILNLIVCKTNECIPKKLQVIFNVKRKADAPTEVKECEEIEIK
ncbi:NHL repeat-containing protein 2 [Chelonus insularis]|uniref:NHL repeat-containing protein 2 n=1 Tax=Chelonus insularis TaxID=460826 RepID=UPI00158E9E59|nr:NHL repeat-containing protein 2 [Chelonus insularis]